MLKSIAITPDGNRRYAEKAGLNLIDAYHAGFKKAEDVFDWCLQVKGLETATIYALSTENLARNREELDHLAFVVDDVEAAFRDLVKKGAGLAIDPAHAKGTEIYVKDPSGIWIELLE